MSLGGYKILIELILLVGSDFYHEEIRIERLNKLRFRVGLSPRMTANFRGLLGFAEDMGFHPKSADALYEALTKVLENLG